MRIGVDICSWRNQRGIGRFVRELVTALLEVDAKNEYLFFVDSQTFDRCSFPADMNILPVETGSSPDTAMTFESSRSMKDVWAFSRAVGSARLDVFFNPFWSLYFPILDKRTRVVSVIHDLIEYQHGSSISAVRWLLMRTKHRLCLSRSHAIVTPSQHSKQEVINRFRVPPGKVHVIFGSASSIFRPPAEGAPYPPILQRHGISHDQRFLLFVGSIDGHKDLPTLLQAHSALIDDSAFTDVKLVIAGATENAMQSSLADLEERVRGQDLSTSVIFTGFVTDEELVDLYQFAALVVMPSAVEGFGLPALEAMACATPVLACCGGALPEVIGSGGMFFTPSDASSLLAQLRGALTQPEELGRMAAYGLEQARSFSWANSARELVALFGRVGG